jgi:hypothetical protein
MRQNRAQRTQRSIPAGALKNPALGLAVSLPLAAGRGLLGLGSGLRS